MALLKLRGLQQEYTISSVDGLTVQKLWQDNTVPKDRKIIIGQLNFEKKDISFLFLNDENSDRGTEWQKKIIEWNEYRKNLVAQSPEYKAKINFQYYEMLWYIHTGNWEAQRKDEAEKLAQKFFEENKNRTVVNYLIWKPLLQNENAESTSMQSQVQTAGIKMLENMMRQDMQDAKFTRNAPQTSYNAPQRKEIEKTMYPSSDEINVAEIPF